MPYADWLPLLAPNWLQGPVGKPFLQQLGQLLDDERALLVAATQARFPDVTPLEALPIMGAERQLEQGPNEAPELYAGRLKNAWGTWKDAGSHPALLRQLEIAGFTVSDKWLIQRNGRRSTITANVVSFASGPFWTFDGKPPAFYNQFGLLFPGAMPSVTWDPTNGFSPDAATINRLCQKWRPGKAKFMGTYVIASSAVWGWPTTRTWGGMGVNWASGSARFIPPK